MSEKEDNDRINASESTVTSMLFVGEMPSLASTCRQLTALSPPIPASPHKKRPQDAEGHEPTQSGAFGGSENFIPGMKRGVWMGFSARMGGEFSVFSGLVFSWGSGKRQGLNTEN